MKKLSLIAAALVLASAGASAATTGDAFDVSVTLTSACSVTTAAADIAMTYTAFAAAASTGSASTTFSCTRGLTPTFQFDTTAVGATSSAADGTVGNTITSQGVLRGLLYTLSATVPAKTAGTAATAGAGGAGGSIGTADTYSLTINAAIPAGQAGDPTGLANQARTLIITY